MKLKKRSLLYFTLFILSFFYTNQSGATHLAGSEISYACTATPGVYQVIFKVYRDCGDPYPVCSGCPTPGSLSAGCSLAIAITGAGGTCNGTSYGTQSIGVLVSQSALDVVQLCNTATTICTNCGTRTAGTFTPGIEVYVFQGNINLTALPTSCCLVRIGYTTCCRNSAITTLANPSSLSFYSEAIINRCASPCNSSPVFNSPLEFVLCSGVDAKLSISGEDADGDSLSYALGASLTGPGISAPYVSPYSIIVPFPYLGAPIQSPPALPPVGFNFNAVTGDIIFRPLGFFVSNLVIEVKQWKTIAGVATLMGTTRRDHQLYSQTCLVNTAVIAKKYDSLGNALVAFGYSGDSIRICENERTCRIFSASDIATTDTTDLSWSNPTSMPGASFVPLYTASLRATNGPRQDSVKFCWTAPPNSGRNIPYVFVLTAKDRKCPIPFKSSRTISIYVNPVPYANIIKTITGIKQYKFNYTRTNAIANNSAQTQWLIETASFSNTFTTINADSIPSYLFPSTGRFKIKLKIYTNACGYSTIIDSIEIRSLNLVNLKNAVCKGDSSGAVTVFSISTATPVLYKLNNASYQSNAVFQNLAAGNYTIKSKDILNNTDSISIIISEPDSAIRLKILTSNNLRCKGDSSGSIMLSVSNSTTPVQFKTASSIYQNSNVFNKLTAATYTFFVADSLNCLAAVTVNLTEPANTLLLNYLKKNVSCNGDNNGLITLNALGGTGPFQYKQSTGTYTVNTVYNNLSVGSYNFSVKDSNNCISTAVINIAEPTPFTKSFNTTNTLCLGASTGTATINLNGGTLPYVFKWNNLPVQNTNKAINLGAGYVSVMVTDSHACVFKDSVLIGFRPVANNEQICAVSNDTVTGQNTIIWDKKVNAGIAAYKIFVSTSATGIFTLIGIKSFNNLSVLKDTVSASLYQPVYYYMKVTDSCANESEASILHKTIFLTASTITSGMLTLNWNSYTGAVNSISQQVLRSINGGPFTLLATLPLSSVTYTDTFAAAGLKRYLIDVTLNPACNANYAHIYSNTVIRNSTALVENIVVKGSFEIYPNPTFGTVKIRAVKNGDYIQNVEIINIAGSKIKEQFTNGLTQEMVLDMDMLADGSYTIVVVSKTGVRYPYKIILNKGK
ncbi:MAG: hypothetical protein H7296_14955 [Bacteroidia bacterium]|nr:hypothetical protein [Bacteroidia bacterium]